jgi:hypothetical protein
VVLRAPRPGRHRVPAWRDEVGRWHAADPVRALLALLAAGRAAEKIGAPRGR